MFGLFNGFMRREEEVRRLEKLKKRFKTAKDLGKKHCVRCGFCCYRRTCTPTPFELKKIAKFFKLTPAALIKKYFVIDKIKYNDPYYVKPAGENIKDLVGKFIPAERTFNEGKCIFLDKNNLCKIHPVRPQSARDCKCWEDEDTELGRDYIKAWKGNKLLKEFGIDGEDAENEANDY